MSKQQINEKQLLADAKAWFENKYEASPQKCRTNFIKVWHKPTPLRKTTAVVFAPTEEIGKAFIWEQNFIFRTLGNFWIVGVSSIIFMFASLHALSQGDEEIAIAIVTVFTILCLCALLFFRYMAKKCKKLEKIHQWNVEIYYP